MIHILKSEYIEQTDWTLYTVKFSSDDYQIILDGRLEGDYTDEEIVSELFDEYEAWIARIS